MRAANEHWPGNDRGRPRPARPGSQLVEEHQKIITSEVNPERKTLYQLCWHLGASQGDIASLKREDVDWIDGTVSFTRKKTGVPVLVHLGGEALNLFKDLPGGGMSSLVLSAAPWGGRGNRQ